MSQNHKEAPNGEGRLLNVSMRFTEAARQEPPTGWTVLECLDDDRQMVNEHLASALSDPRARYVRVPVQLLARFSALAADLSSHLWRNTAEVMDLPLVAGDE